MAELTYTVKEAAEALGISRRSMYELLHCEDFNAGAKILGRRVIVKSLLAEWLEQQAGGQKNTATSSAKANSGKGGKQTLTGTDSTSSIHGNGGFVK